MLTIAEKLLFCDLPLWSDVSLSALLNQVLYSEGIMYVFTITMGYGNS